MTQDDTETLFDRARVGDRAAFDALCRVELPRLSAFVASALGENLRAKIEPDDVIQETFLRAFGSMRVFRDNDLARFHSWLSSIAQHLIWNASRKRGLKEAPLAFETPARDATPSRELRRKERLERLEASLARLPSEQREAIVLSKIEGLRGREIAERMGRSEDSVRQLISRGLREMRSTFGDTESLRLPWPESTRGDTDGDR